MQPEIKPALQSSVDPTQLSLTIDSIAKTAIGLIGTLIAYKGIDSQPITTQLQAIVDAVVTVIPVGFAAWHSMQILVGLWRKTTVVEQG